MSRSHAEEPGTGADRAAEETSGAAEILSGLLCCPEGVLTEASCTQTTQSHAGRMDNQSAHTQKSNYFIYIYVPLLFYRRWLTQTSQPRRSSRNIKTKSKPRRGRSSSCGLDIKPRSTGAMRSKTWPWCSEPRLVAVHVHQGRRTGIRAVRLNPGNDSSDLVLWATCLWIPTSATSCCYRMTFTINYFVS